MRTAIHVRCDNQVLSYVEMPFIASGDVNEDKIEFEFGPMWEGFIKTAVFYRTETDVYHILLEEDDTCIIPHEVLAEPGPLYFGVFGTRGDRVRTSEIIQYTIKRGAITEATKVSDPTPDIYSRILAACEEAVRIANEALNKAPSGDGGTGLTDEQAADLAANTEARHTHGDKTVSIPADEVSYTHSNIQDKSGTVKGALDEAITYVTEVLSPHDHTHGNKVILDLLADGEGALLYNGKPVATEEYVNNAINGTLNELERMIDESGVLS